MNAAARLYEEYQQRLTAQHRYVSSDRTVTSMYTREFPSEYVPASRRFG